MSLSKCVTAFLVLLLAASGASTVFLHLKVREREREVAGLVERVFGAQPPTDPSDVALRLAREIYAHTSQPLQPDELDWFARWESTSYFNVSAAVSLKHGGFGVRGHPIYGACGTMSRTLLNALWHLEIPARKLQLLPRSDGTGGDHTLVEFRDGDVWRVISPSDHAFVWRNARGEIASAAEIQADESLFAAIYTIDPDYPYRFDRYGNIRWSKLPGPIQGIARTLLGEERFRRTETPRLYDTPRTLLRSVSLTLFAATLLIFVVRSRWLRHRAIAARQAGVSVNCV